MTRKELLKKLKPFYNDLKKLQDKHWVEINNLEKEMNKELNRDDLEFFYCDNCFAGIGNIDRSLKLITDYELERIK